MSGVDVETPAARSHRVQRYLRAYGERDACVALGPEDAIELADHLQAVAELIEAAIEMNRLAKGPAGGVSQAEKRAIVNRMEAALANVTGGAA